ncbi:hypothetical protein AGABI2DRAFT_194835, partial [Agaricus bisporus var. bisporus H97]|uniref:hypothetical protein n=1 Tax=Agaricus bisporus var. bisporus (strain H97 / ATCC MYA-4626 / FGSC 10389) TaxID=936046 RepID=UPI00029F6601
MTNAQALLRVRRYRPSPSPLSCISPRSRSVYSPRPRPAFLHQDAVARSTAAEPEEFIIPPIFDIFDAPSRLGQSRELIQSTTNGLRRPAKKENSENDDFSLPRPPPSSLPPPIIFDGPAYPKSLPLIALQRRVDDAFIVKPTSARRSRPHHSPFLPHGASETLVEMFDGPARLTRFSRGTSRQHRNGKNILFL